MDQIIILIIIYVLYSLFSAFTKRMREQSRQRETPDEGTPARRPAQPAGEAKTEAPEINIPPFLKEMLGMDEPRPVPQPPKREQETEHPQPAFTGEGQTPVMPEKIESPMERIEEVLADSPIKKESLAKPELKLEVQLTEKKSTFAVSVTSLLKNKQRLKQAFVLKEILDSPVSKRPRRFPYAGEI